METTAKRTKNYYKPMISDNMADVYPCIQFIWLLVYLLGRNYKCCLWFCYHRRMPFIS